MVEWDYSRYTRALGLGRTPGLDTLKRRGCVVAAGRPDFWDDAAGQLEQWSKNRNWRLVRVSARPSTVVPDPVIYHLGVEVTHPDSLIFCGAGQQGKPALGKRPRSPAMRIPLSPAERWLIAADRVRRRVRAESAMSGLVIFIDDAELLTPNALSILSYFLDAQCAWKSHLLSAPAQIYVVFATQAREEEWFRKTLERFSPRAEPFVVRDVVGPRVKGLARRDWLTVEQDHIHEVLRGVGFALSLRDTRSLFGVTSTAAIERLVSQGVLRCRRERRQFVVCAPHAPEPGSTCAAVARATASVHAALHSRLANWPWLATSILIHHGAVAVGSSSPGAVGLLSMAGLGPLTPLILGRKFLCSRRGADWSHCEAHAAFAVSVAASVREFELAKKLLLRELEREEWSREQVPRLIRVLASLGRTIADRAVPPGYWLSFASRRASDRFSDPLSIAAELFFDLRRMNLGEIESRYDVAVSLLQGSPDPEDLGPEEREFRARVLLLLLRAYRYLFELHSRSVNQLPCPESRTALATLERMPGFILGSLAYSELISPNAEVEWGRVDTALGSVRDLCLASGCCKDSRVALTRIAFEIARAHDVPRCRDLADEAVLLFDFDLPKYSKKALLWLLSAFFGKGGRSVYVATHLLSSSRLAATRTGERVSDAQWVAPMLAEVGDVDGALQALSRASLAPGVSPYSALTAIVSKADLHFETLNWAEVEGGAWGDHLDGVALAAPHLGAYGRHYVMGLRMFQFGRYRQAISEFEAARASIGRPTLGEARTLYLGACTRASECRALLRAFVGLSGDSHARAEPDARLFTRLVISLRRNRERLSFGALVRGLEDWCRTRDSIQASGVVSVTMLALDEWERRGGVISDDVLGRIATAAPTLFARAVRALGEGYSIEVPGSSEISQLVWSLRFLASHWDPASGGPVAEALSVALRRPPVIIESANLQSHSRKTRTPYGWNEDLALLKEALRSASSAALTRDDPLGRAQVITMAGVLGRTEVIWHRCVVSSAAPRESAGLDRESSSVRHLREFLGSSTSAVAIRESIRTAASCSFPVLVVGETGTGKGLIAELIADAGLHAAGPIVALNCSAVPDDLLEVELFGAKKGAYTGAV
ncbi:MAG: sigma 54-interacting transcriptional regulator, partial [Planctomycetota bacterium]